MLLAITGTPGTGKTTVAPLVSTDLGYERVDLNAFIQEQDLDTDFDEDRHSAIVDVEALNDSFPYASGEDVVVEGHLSHHLAAADVIVVLRTDPDELEDRLTDKKWEDEKVEENVMAERLDVILQEAVRVHPENTFEVDTTGRDPETVAEEIVYLVRRPEERSMYAPGGTDWDLENMDNI